MDDGVTGRSRASGGAARRAGRDSGWVARDSVRGGVWSAGERRLGRACAVTARVVRAREEARSRVRGHGARRDRLAWRMVRVAAAERVVRESEVAGGAADAGRGRERWSSVAGRVARRGWWGAQGVGPSSPFLFPFSLSLFLSYFTLLCSLLCLF